MAPAGTGVSNSVDNTGGGSVTISYGPTTDSCPTPPTPPTSAPNGGGAGAGGAAVAVVAQPNFTG